jgi:hypothetical protein
MITGLRKFIIALIVIGIASLMLWFGKVTGDNFTSILIWITGLYMGGNVAAKVAEKVSIEAKSTEVKQP